jgi:iron complex outermembrane receptor protein
MKDVPAVTTPANPGVGVPAYSLVDLLGSYELNKEWQLRAGVTNLGNHAPVFVSSSQFSTDPSVFDVVGRSYYVGVHLTL